MNNMIYLFSYIRKDLNNGSSGKSSHEHGFYNSVDKQFYGYVEYTGTYYKFKYLTPCVCSSFYCNIPTIIYITDINYADNRYSIFNRELEKLIFEKL